MYKEETLVLAEKEEKIALPQKATEQVAETVIKEDDELETSQQSKKNPQKDRSNERSTNAFSSQAFKNKPSSVIEKPNYDFIKPLSAEEEEKIFKIEKIEKSAKKSKFNSKRLRLTLFSLLMAVFTIWGIVNVARIDTLQASYNALYQQYYDINLPNYLKNLGQLDAVNQNNMDNLFETIPEESVPPTSIDKKTNWFDRICEFLVGLFGG